MSILEIIIIYIFIYMYNNFFFQKKIISKYKSSWKKESPQIFFIEPNFQN